MFWLVVLIASLVWGFSRIGRKPKFADVQTYSVFTCTVHGGTFRVPGYVPYAYCPTCVQTFEAMEREFSE